MRRPRPIAIPSKIPWLLGAVLLLGSCSDSRLDPAGLRRATKAAIDHVPLGVAPKPRRVAARPRPRPVTAATIPTPPYRLDVRVDPADLALLPADAAVVAALRPELPASLTRILGPYAQALHRAPQLQWLGKQLLSKSLAAPLGLRRDRAILVGLLAPTGPMKDLAKRLQAQATLNAPPDKTAAALTPANLPHTTLRIRIVAQVADEAKARAGVTALVGRARRAGMKLGSANAPQLPAPLKTLATKGVLALYQGPDSVMAIAVTRDRLLVDILLPVSGAWTAARAAKELNTHLMAVTKARVTRPFERVVLLSSADLALVIRGALLARAARWLGVRALLTALARADAKQIPPLLKLGWRIANLPLDFHRAGAQAFDGCGLRFYLMHSHPQLRLSWHLTDAGRKLLGPQTAAVSGRDLGANNALVEQWLKPIAARAPELLPAKGPFAKPKLLAALLEGGGLMWPLALAEFWPQLLPRKPVRKAVIKILRMTVRPGRFVRRINAHLGGRLLELVVEGSPPRAKPPTQTSPAPAPSK